MDNSDNEMLKLFSGFRFYCEKCDYGTSKKSNINNHYLSAKHVKTTEKQPGLSKKYKCTNCEKSFNDRAGLWRHKKKCIINNVELTYSTHNEFTKEMFIMLFQQNNEFKELIMDQNTKMLELAKNSNCITNNNNINTTNNHNFNMNFFLNEQCKDALNIGEFVNTLPLTLEDLENTGKVGYVKGITDIVVRGLKEMDVHKRPIHCSDLKREVIYVKDNDVWHKDEDNVKVKKAIQNIGTRNYRQVKEWIEKYPEAKDISTKKHDQYVQIRLKCTGGSNTAEDDKMQNKILSNIAKLIHINK